MRTLYLDIETYSSADLPSVGVYRYAEDKDFTILLLGYAWDDEPVRVVDLTAEEFPLSVQYALLDDAVVKVAHNSAFERTCLSKYLGKRLNPDKWEDTMIMASQCGLPMSLDAVGQALELGEDQAKMKEGKALIRKFCQSRKPTKSNPSTRLRREDDPEAWEVFIEYNRRDVEVERTIYKRLIKWRANPSEFDLWVLDQNINDRGMRVDLTLAENAIDIGNDYRERLLDRAQAISGLQNPNSTEQIKQWLREQEGITATSLNKKVVADVVASLSNEKSREFMALRTEFSKSSVKKYEAIERSVCEDGCIHGCFMFCGAGRTGRWAGRLVQLQNLPQNHLEDLDSARQLVLAGDAEGLELIYGDVQDTLSQLIRTALVPEPGQKFIVADFAAIEARVIAWIAGEQWRMDVFRDGGDIYCMSASQMFKVPVVKHGVNGHLRQKGKIAELACIARGQLVLTDHGLVPIQDVTTDMRVWDGENWVEHDGVVCRGKKEVIEYEGLTATEDHLVWIVGEQRPVPFGLAASRNARLVQAGDGRNEIRLGGDNFPYEAVELQDEPLLGSHPLRGMRKRAVDGVRKSSEREKPRLSSLFSTQTRADMAVQENDSGKAKMRSSYRDYVPGVRRAWYSVLFRQRERSVSVHDVSWADRSEERDRQDRHQRKLRAGKSSLGNEIGELLKSAKECVERMGSAVLAISKKRGHQKVVSWGNEGADHRGCSANGSQQREELARHCGEVEVYDIRNAGPNHRFTVSGRLVHNCGYGGGVGALKAFGADKMGMTDEEMAQTVDLWRESSPHICALWRSLEQAAIRCVKRQRPTLSTVGQIRFDFEDGVLWMTLPSGRRIAYWGASYGQNKFGNDELSYMGTDQRTKKWTRLTTWGGKLVENLVQATARDCLKEAMLNLDAAGYDIRGHVHDEVIISAPLTARVEDVSALMGANIAWAPGLLLRADGYECEYYRKD